MAENRQRHLFYKWIASDPVQEVARSEGSTRFILHVAAGSLPGIFSKLFQRVQRETELSHLGGVESAYPQPHRTSDARFKRSARPAAGGLSLLRRGGRRRSHRRSGWHSFRAALDR